MKMRIPAALLAAAALAACGVDSTPQSSGTSGATNPSSSAPAPAPEEKKDEPKAEAEKPTEGEKKAD